ncbi:MAG: hypothetical protein V8Q84_03245 [Bilophila sp.]
MRRSILFDARLDILSCGMGERSLLDVARRLDAVAEIVGDSAALEAVDGELWPGLWDGIPGTARLVKTASLPADLREVDGCELVRLPSHDDMLAVPRAYLEADPFWSVKRIRPAARRPAQRRAQRPAHRRPPRR